MAEFPNIGSGKKAELKVDLRPTLFIGVGRHGLLRAKRCGKHLGRGHALFDQGACHRQGALCRQLQVVSKALVLAVADALVIGETADHQHLVALTQVHP